jgi:multiple sugar transport system substrate-binding protein
MNRKLFAILSMIAIASLVLVACGTAATVEPTTNIVASPTTGAVVANPTTKPVEVVTIRWRTRPDNQAEQDVYQAISDDLSKQLAPQGIKLQYDPSPVTGYLDKLTTELSAGTAPDVFWIPGASTADYAKPGTLLDLAPIAGADKSFKLSDYYDAPMKELQENGHLWGLPRDISTLVLYVNEDLFKAKGIEDPIATQAAGKWDWDHFLADAQALTDPANKTYGFSMSDWWGVWGYFIYAAGGNFFNADRKACGLTTPESQAGLQFLQDIFNKYKVATPPGMEGGVGETEFIAGQAGMYPNGRWMTPGMRTNAKYNWNVVDMPKGKVNSTWLFWGPYVIAKNTKYPEQAWAVIKALTSPEVQAKVAAMGTNIPSNKGQAGVNAFLASKPPENNQAFLNGAAYAQAEIPLFTGSWDAIVNGVYQPAVDNILNGKGTVADITTTACEAADPLFTK